MKLYCNTNKFMRKGQLVTPARIKYVEACLFLRNEPKYKGATAGPPSILPTWPTGSGPQACQATAQQPLQAAAAPGLGANSSAATAPAQPGGSTGGNTETRIPAQRPAAVIPENEPDAPAQSEPGSSGPNANTPTSQKRSPSRDASVFARPVGVKKMKQMQALEKDKARQNRLASAVEVVGAALKTSAAQRGNAAKQAMRMRLISKAGLSEEEEKKAYRDLLEEVSRQDTTGACETDQPTSSSAHAAPGLAGPRRSAAAPAVSNTL